MQVIFDGFADDARDSRPMIIPVMPRDATVIRNSYKQADSFEMVFDANDFPIDPVLVRAGAVELYMFQVAGIPGANQEIMNRQNSFEDSANRQPRDLVDSIALEVNLAAAVDRFTFSNQPAIVGLFDEHGVEYSSSGKWVSISGQDYTDFLIKKQWKPNLNGTARRIPTRGRLDTVLRNILAEADEEGRLRLVVEDIDPDDLPQLGRTEIRGKRRGIPVQQDTSYWDVMYKIAARYGTILFVRGLDVVLTKVPSQTGKFEHRIKRLAWGHNLDQLNMKRAMGKETAPTIVVKSYDPIAKQTITVDYPAGSFRKVKRSTREPKKTGKVAASIRKTEEYEIIRAYGVTDRRVLRDIAKNMHTLRGRPERTVNFATKDLRDFRDNSMMDLQTGDPVTIGFVEYNKELLADESVSQEEKFSHLVGRGYGEAVARVIAQNYQIFDVLKRPLRVNEITLTYSAESGISVEGELNDFVVIDGIRDGDIKETRRQKRKNKYRRRDGSKIGPSADLEEAFIREKG